MSKDKLRRSTNPADNDFTPSWDQQGNLEGEFQAPPEEHRDDRFDQRGMSWQKKLGLTLAGLGLAGTGGLIVKNSLGGDAAPTHDRQPAASATPNPGEQSPTDTTSATPEVETAANPYGISVAEHPTFESAVTAYLEKLDEYEASGSDSYDQPGDPERLVALYGPDWESSPELAANVHDTIEDSIIISTNHYATGENGGTEYEVTTEVLGVSDVKESPDQVSGTVKFHETDNLMDTVLGTASQNSGHNMDAYGNWHYTFNNVDGYWQVVELDNLENN